MGHIVNPVSMRIGWFSDWMDVWYSDQEYYVDYFYAILKIRLFLISFFFGKNFEKQGYFFSHFSVINYSNSLLVNIFYYDGKFHSVFEELDLEPLKIFKDLIKEREIFFPYACLGAIKFFSIVTIFHDLYVELWSDQTIKYLFKIFLSFRYKSLFNFFNLKRGLWSRVSYRSVRFHFLFFFKLVCFLRSYRLKKLKISKFRYSFDAYLNRFVVCHYVETLQRSFLRCLSFYLEYYFKLFSNFENVSIHYFLLDNDTVTARFLSRFIAIRLRQNHTIWEALNPIRRDLTKIRNTYQRVPSKSKSFNIDNQSNVSFRMHCDFFKSVLSFLFSFFYKWFYNFYNENLSFFTLDFLLLFRSFALIFTNYKLFVWSFVSLKRKIGLGYFFSYIWFDLSFDLFWSNKYFFLPSVVTLKPIFLVIADVLYLDLKRILFQDLFLFLKINSFKFSNFSFNRFFLYHFWIFNYKKYLTTNRKLVKSVSKRSYRPLLGFKLHCFGRFTRKQRKSVIRILDVKMPLNTLSARIDYGFFAIPLKNSVVGVKVWLYRPTDNMGFTYKFY